MTADGSHTIAIPEWKVTYHSHHGAIQESMHVFTGAGLDYVWNLFSGQTIHILEIGFGTGLNALLSLQHAIRRNRALLYTAIEKFPLPVQQTSRINYGEILSIQDEFEQLHSCEWEKPVSLHPLFTLEKKQLSLPAPLPCTGVHCIYFDAFAPDVQPELWSQSMFEDLYRCLAPGGVLVTYSSKGTIRRAMTAAGFMVEKIPGPRGKREMVRATRICAAGFVSSQDQTASRSSPQM